MKYVRMGNSGLKLTQVTFGSALTIGTECKDQVYADELIDSAWEEGIRSYDVSNNYGMGEAERLLAKALSRYDRQSYVIATKGSLPIGNTPYHKGLSRKHILWAFEESIKRMELSYVDIYYAHRYDPETSMEEIVRTFHSLIESGVVRYWATSEWSIEALEECHAICNRLGTEKPIIEQSIYSFAVRKIEKNGLKDFCCKNHVGILGYSPLCQGFLTGKYRNGIPSDSRIAKKEQLAYDKTMNFYNQNRARIDGFLAICNCHGISGAQLAIKWCIRNQIYPVLGASKPEQLSDTLQGLELEINEEVWRELDLIQ